MIDALATVAPWVAVFAAGVAAGLQVGRRRRIRLADERSYYAARATGAVAAIWDEAGKALIREREVDRLRRHVLRIVARPAIAMRAHRLARAGRWPGRP